MGSICLSYEHCFRQMGVKKKKPAINLIDKQYILKTLTCLAICQRSHLTLDEFYVQWFFLKVNVSNECVIIALIIFTRKTTPTWFFLNLGYMYKDFQIKIFHHAMVCWVFIKFTVYMYQNVLYLTCTINGHIYY